MDFFLFLLKFSGMSWLKSTWAGKFQVCQNHGFSPHSLGFQDLFGAQRVKSIKGTALFGWLSFSLPWWSCGVYQGTAFHIISHQLSIPETEGWEKTWPNWAKCMHIQCQTFYGYWMMVFEWFISRWFFNLNSESIALK